VHVGECSYNLSESGVSGPNPLEQQSVDTLRRQVVALITSPWHHALPSASITLDTEDSGSRMPPDVLVGATMRSMSTRSSSGINRRAAIVQATTA
jgi:hypothetical protein